LSVTGPVFNLHGMELATGHADLFDSSIAAPVAYDEWGNLITNNTDVITCCTALGTSAGGLSCGDWNGVSSGHSSRIGSAITTVTWLSTEPTKACSLAARLCGLSPALTAPLWGDYDGSGTVDGRDFLEWQRYYGTKPPPEFLATRSFFDGNGFAAVGAIDLEVWAAHFGQSLPAVVLAIPEPATLAALVFGLLVLATTGRPYDRPHHLPWGSTQAVRDVVSSSWPVEK
jgi:hypothetical protein